MCDYTRLASLNLGWLLLVGDACSPYNAGLAGNSTQNIQRTVLLFEQRACHGGIGQENPNRLPCVQLESAEPTNYAR